MTNQRDQLIRRVSRSIVWGQVETWRRDSARALAAQVVDDLLNGSAEGKATERGVKVILTQIEKAS